MAAPRIAGFTTAGRAYEATAESAAQDMTNLDVLELSGIRGKTELQDKSVINLAAASGIYDSKSEIIKLNQRVSVASSSGVELNLTEALVMVREGKIVSRRPVEVHHGNDTLNSNELEVINSGELIRFIGDVRVKLNPKDSDHDSPTKSPQRTQVASGVPQVFSRNPNEPVQIQSATLDVRSKEHIATFIGKVHLVQGDATLKCATLIISYQESADSGADQFGIAGQQQIRSVDARGGVTITQKEQTATGDSGTFDMKANKVLLTGNVALKQGQNVVRGDRLIADLSTGVSRIESNGHSNVQSEFVSNSQERKSRPDPEVNNTRQTPLSQPLKLH